MSPMGISIFGHFHGPALACKSFETRIKSCLFHLTPSTVCTMSKIAMDFIGSIQTGISAAKSRGLDLQSLGDSKDSITKLSNESPSSEQNKNIPQKQQMHQTPMDDLRCGLFELPCLKGCRPGDVPDNPQDIHFQWQDQIYWVAFWFVSWFLHYGSRICLDLDYRLPYLSKCSHLDVPDVHKSEAHISAWLGLQRSVPTVNSSMLTACKYQPLQTQHLVYILQCGKRVCLHSLHPLHAFQRHSRWRCKWSPKQACRVVQYAVFILRDVCTMYVEDRFIGLCWVDLRIVELTDPVWLQTPAQQCASCKVLSLSFLY